MLTFKKVFYLNATSGASQEINMHASYRSFLFTGNRGYKAISMASS